MLGRVFDMVKYNECCGCVEVRCSAVRFFLDMSDNNLLVGRQTLLEKCMDGHELCLESQRSPSFETRDATEWSANAEFLFDRLVFDIFRNRVVPCVVWCSKELVDCCVGSVPQIC